MSKKLILLTFYLSLLPLTSKAAESTQATLSAVQCKPFLANQNDASSDFLARLEVAKEQILDRPELLAVLENIEAHLSSKQRDAIEQAHAIMGARPDFSVSELKQKATILSRAGFSAIEREAIMRSGLAGEIMLTASQVAQQLARAKANLRAEERILEEASRPRGLLHRFDEWLETSVDPTGSRRAMSDAEVRRRARENLRNLEEWVAYYEAILRIPKDSYLVRVYSSPL